MTQREATSPENIAERRTWRVIPPAGGFPPPMEVHRARKDLLASGDVVAQFERELAKSFRVPDSVCFASGTAALYALFSTLSERGGKRRTIALPAYTCPNVAAAAVRAGLDLFLLDVDPDTLEPVPGSLSDKDARSLIAVVFTNLYGMLDDLDPWRERFPADDILFVDDVCQSALGRDPHGRAGARGGIGVLSFGRGKAYCGVGGGALLISGVPHTFADYVSATTLRAVRGGYSPEVGGAALLKAAVLNVLERPSFYAIPTRLPFLGLGKTTYDDRFEYGGIDGGDAVVACACLRREERIAREHVIRVERWRRLLGDKVSQPAAARGLKDAVLTRYPVRATSEAQRVRWIAELTRDGLGGSLSYPQTLDRYRELSGRFAAGELRGAHDVAKTIITLPVHPGVTSSDQERAAEIILRK